MHDLDCEDVGELNEHVGVKIETKENRVKLTQPELIQSLNDEVDILPGIQCICQAHYARNY